MKTIIVMLAALAMTGAAHADGPKWQLWECSPSGTCYTRGGAKVSYRDCDDEAARMQKAAKGNTRFRCREAWR